MHISSVCGFNYALATLCCEGNQQYITIVNVSAVIDVAQPINVAPLWT